MARTGICFISEEERQYSTRRHKPRARRVQALATFIWNNVFKTKWRDLSPCTHLVKSVMDEDVGENQSTRARLVYCTAGVHLPPLLHYRRACAGEHLIATYDSAVGGRLPSGDSMPVFLQGRGQSSMAKTFVLAWRKRRKWRQWTISGQDSRIDGEWKWRAVWRPASPNLRYCPPTSLRTAALPCCATMFLKPYGGY